MNTATILRNRVTTPDRNPPFAVRTGFSRGICLGFAAIFWCAVLVGTAGAQTAEQTTARLNEKIAELKEKIQAENEYFQKYRDDKSKLIKQKTKEQAALNKELTAAEAEAAQLRREIREQELRIDQMKRRNELVNKTLRELCASQIESIARSIPFEQQKRSAVLKAIMVDIDEGRSDMHESFARLTTFLNNDEQLCFDSQATESVVSINGKAQKATMLRIGRIVFAADTGNSVYLFYPSTNGFVLDEQTELSMEQKLNIRTAIKVIQGKKPPELIKIPVYSRMITTAGASDKKPASEFRSNR